MKHTCGIDGDPGAVAPLDGRCAACDAGAQRVNDATAITESHWRGIVAEKDAEIATLKAGKMGLEDQILRQNSIINALRTELALRSDDH